MTSLCKFINSKVSIECFFASEQWLFEITMELNKLKCKIQMKIKAYFVSLEIYFKRILLIYINKILSSLMETVLFLLLRSAQFT